MARKTKTNPKSKIGIHDTYLASVRADQRAVLEKLRRAIKAAAPGAEECISYQLAAFRLDGKPLVAFGATDKHCAFFLMSGTTVAAHEDLLADYDTSKGTIRFQPDKPLPAALVRKLVKARMVENASSGVKAGKSAGKPVKKTKKELERRGKPAKESASDADVDEFLRRLKHPLKPQLEALRRLILGASPAIREGIKWNSPSFRTSDWFATINVHGKDSLRLILHTGAKVNASATKGLQIADPAGLLKWLAKDRCLVTLTGKEEVEAKRAALQKIVRNWVRQC